MPNIKTLILPLLALLLTVACAAETPTPAPAPTATPNLGATVQAAVSAALLTPTPTPTPNINATIAAGIAATNTAMPTPTPTPAPTPNINATVEARLSATIAAIPTATPAPTPNINATVEARISATIAALPTPTPTATLPNDLEPRLTILKHDFYDPPCGSVFINGENMPIFSSMNNLEIDGISVLPKPHPVTDSKGEFFIDIPLPELEPGTHTIIAEVDGEVATTTFLTIISSIGANENLSDPKIALSPDTVQPGEHLVIKGENMLRCQRVSKIMLGVLDTTPIPLILTDREGEFSVSIIVPNLEPGTHTVTVELSGAVTTNAFLTIIKPD